MQQTKLLPSSIHSPFAVIAHMRDQQREEYDILISSSPPHFCPSLTAAPFSPFLLPFPQSELVVLIPTLFVLLLGILLLVNMHFLHSWDHFVWTNGRIAISSAHSTHSNNCLGWGQHTFDISSITRPSFLTFRILHASSRSNPVCFVMRFEPDNFDVAALDPSCAAAAALLAAACLYAWTNARPTTCEPTRMTCAIKRCAWMSEYEQGKRTRRLPSYFGRNGASLEIFLQRLT